jgi:hypothetical protein
MYKEAAAAAEAAEQGTDESHAKNDSENVVDAEFHEVDDSKRKMGS